MDKNEIKKRIRFAIENSPYKEQINKASLFGSYSREEQTDESDVDVILEIDPASRFGFFKMAELQLILKNSIDKEVDLLTPQSISKFFRDEVLKKAETIYERK